MDDEIFLDNYNKIKNVIISACLKAEIKEVPESLVKDYKAVLRTAADYIQGKAGLDDLITETTIFFDVLGITNSDEASKWVKNKIIEIQTPKKISVSLDLIGKCIAESSNSTDLLKCLKSSS